MTTPAKLTREQIQHIIYVSAKAPIVLGVQAVQLPVEDVLAICDLAIAGLDRPAVQAGADSLAEALKDTKKDRRKKR